MPKSASKIVFVMLAFTACSAFMYGIVRGAITLETKDFMLLATSAFSFYFANKGDGGSNANGEKYLGK